MFDELEKIRKDQYLGNLQALANSYGINGSYIQYNSTNNPSENGVYFICGYNNPNTFSQPNALSLFNPQNESSLNKYCSHAFRLDGCDPFKTYLAIKDFCEDAKFMKTIYQDKYINTLDKAVKNFNMYGTYILYDKNRNSDYTGMYFVCGIDKNAVNDPNINIKNIMENRRKNSDYFHYSIAAFPLDSFYSFATHQAIMNFCRDSDFIRNIYKKYNRQIPEKVTAKALITFKMLNSNLKNPNLTADERATYEKVLSDCFDIEETFHNPISRKFEKNQFLMSGQYDTSKGKIENWFRQNFGQDNNCVSLEHLFTDCNGAVGHLSVNLSIADKIKEEFRKRPDILYWMSKPMGEIIDFPEGQGYGPNPEDNETRTVDIAYNAAFEQDVDNIVNRICYPEAFNITPEEMCSKSLTPYLISISTDEYKNFVSLCTANNVLFCIDEKLKTHACGQLNIIVPQEQLKMVDLILSRLCIESEDFQISFERPNSQNPQLPQFSLDDFQNKNSQFSTAAITETLSKKFPNSNFQPLGSSFDDFDR